jgi:hypothetical protein
MVAPKNRRSRELRLKDELTFDSLSAYFHLTLTEAAAKLGICKSLLKMVCRQNGIARWPRRRVRSDLSLSFSGRKSCFPGRESRAYVIIARSSYRWKKLFKSLRTAIMLSVEAHAR